MPRTTADTVGRSRKEVEMLSRFLQGLSQIRAHTRGAIRGTVIVLLIGCFGMLTVTASSVPAHAAGKQAVFPINSKPFGASYGTWSARWWQYAYQFPVHNPPYTGSIYNPLFDETGSQCTLGQSGSVWYMVGVINVSGSAVRDCIVPSHVGL